MNSRPKAAKSAKAGASKSKSRSSVAPSYVLGDLPRAGQCSVLFSTRVTGIDIVVDVKEVVAKMTLAGYVKRTVRGYTDRGDFATIVVRDSESGSDDLKILSIDFA